MLALAQYESELCQCGNHYSVTEDPSNVFMPTERVCRVCAGMDQYSRIQQAADAAADKNRSESAPPQTPRASDGRQTYLRPLSPEEVAARQADSVAAEK